MHDGTLPLALLVALTLATAGCLGSAGDVAAEGDDTDDTSNTSRSDGPDPASGSDGPNGTEDNSSNGNWSEGDEVASGHILVGSPTTRHLCSLTACADQEGVESFRMDDVPPPGSVIATNTTDGAGAGFDIDLYFHTSGGEYLGGCADSAAPGEAGEQTCEVPDDADQGTVDAYRGADLDVTVLVASMPDGTEG